MKVQQKSQKGVGIYPVLKAAELLADPARQQLLQRIALHSGLDQTLYPLFYETLINHFVERVQALPCQPGGKLGGLMDCSLECAELALQDYRKSAAQAFSPLYAYALFSALLLRDIGKILSQQLVVICDGEGRFIREWLAAETSLIGQGKFYKSRLLGGQWLTLGRLATPVLARQCLPKLGFAWLCEEREILQMWFELLAAEEAREVDFIPSRQFINQPQNGRLPLPPLPVKMLQPPATALGEEFVDWLGDGLRSGEIDINTPDAAVQMLDGGKLFIECPKIFQKFSEGYGKSGHWTVVAKQYNYLGLSKLSGDDLVFEKYYSTNSMERVVQKQSAGLFFNTVEAKSSTAAQRQGVVISRAELLYQKQALPPVSPLNLQPVSSSALAQSQAPSALIRSKATTFLTKEGVKKNIYKKSD